MPDGVLTDGLLDRCFGRLKTGPCLEPLSVGVHQADQRNRGITEPRGKSDNVVKTNFWGRIENIMRMQRIETICLGHDISCAGSRLLARQFVYPSESDLDLGLKDTAALVSRTHHRLT